jgi:hypothetical protein
MNIRIYSEEQDDVQNETWQIIVRFCAIQSFVLCYLIALPMLKIPAEFPAEIFHTHALLCWLSYFFLSDLQFSCNLFSWQTNVVSFLELANLNFAIFECF